MRGRAKSVMASAGRPLIPLRREALIGVVASVLAIALVARFQRQGPPYFQAPETAYDHVWHGEHPAAAVIRLCRRAIPLLPREATVTVMTPGAGPHYDTTQYTTAIGLLVYQHVIAPDLDTKSERLPDFVLAVGQPLDHPSYVLDTRFPEGALYKRTR